MAVRELRADAARPDPVPGRRAGDRPGGPRAAWVRLLARPLAADDHRAEFWVRHLRLGVALSEMACLLGLVYGRAAHRPYAVLTTSLALAMMAVVPLFLLLPMRRWSRDLRGVAFFYVWSIGTTVMICTFCVLDGGASSPLVWLLVLTLTYAGLAYPPVGTLVMGAVMVLADVVIALTGDGDLAASCVQAGVLVVLTVMVSWVCRNQWELIDEQHALTERLAHQAAIDALTGCLNRRAFQEQLDLTARGIGPSTPVSLCMIDLDGFKLVNDTDGHGAGDDLLRHIAHHLMLNARAGDPVGRLGGDEFAVLLPGAGAAEAADAGERLRAAVAAAGASYGVTASVGIVTADRPSEARRMLLDADHLMYDAKRAGGNRATLAS